MPHFYPRAESPQIPLVEGKAALADRPVLVIPDRRAPEAPLRLRWVQTPGEPHGPQPVGPAWLRIICALEDRAALEVEVRNACSGEVYGSIPVYFATAGEVFELELNPTQVAAALRDGLTLRLAEDNGPLWIVAETCETARVRPHLYFPGDGEEATLAAFLDTFCSRASLQPCDWMEACVLDGLNDLAARQHPGAEAALEAHLDTFFQADGRMVREDIRGRRIIDTAGGAENTGPAAVLALRRPGHPALGLNVAYWAAHFRPEFNNVSDHSLVAETSYSVAYPMMALALHAGQPALLERALGQLESNRVALTGPGGIWLRNNPHKGGEKSFLNWSRGITWYYLGLVRTLALMPPENRPAALVVEAERVAQFVSGYQLESGLWPCFLHEPAVAPDTSGSAGIAAAVALGIQAGMVAPRHLPMAERALRGLTTYLTPDGWLRGVAQSNKGESHAMDIQRHPFRVIGPWGMGLLAQLYAALP